MNNVQVFNQIMETMRKVEEYKMINKNLDKMIKEIESKTDTFNDEQVFGLKEIKKEHQKLIDIIANHENELESICESYGLSSCLELSKTILKMTS